MSATTMSPAELAPELGTDPKTLRKYLRSITPKEGQPGKGSRWAISATKRDITAMRKSFNEWDAAQKQLRAERAQKAAADAAAQVEVDETE